MLVHLVTTVTGDPACILKCCKKYRDGAVSIESLTNPILVAELTNILLVTSKIGCRPPFCVVAELTNIVLNRQNLECLPNEQALLDKHFKFLFDKYAVHLATTTNIA